MTRDISEFENHPEGTLAPIDRWHPIRTLGTPQADFFKTAPSGPLSTTVSGLGTLTRQRGLGRSATQGSPTPPGSLRQRRDTALPVRLARSARRAGWGCALHVMPALQTPTFGHDRLGVDLDW